jgi:predicted DNA binding CopG/RHH family protein
MKRKNILAIRLNDEELKRLNEKASKKTIAPSTYARSIIVEKLY